MTKNQPRDKRMSEITAAAVDEFLENGYENASMERIAHRAGISKGGLYHHFTGKVELLLYANQLLNEPVYDMMKQMDRCHSATEALNRYIRWYLEYWLSHQKEMMFYFLSFIKTLDNPAFWQMYETYAEKYLLFFQNLFEKGIRNREFIPHSTRTRALALISALDGVLGYLIMNKNLNSLLVIESFQTHFVDSLRLRPDEVGVPPHE